MRTASRGYLQQALVLTELCPGFSVSLVLGEDEVFCVRFVWGIPNWLVVWLPCFIFPYIGFLIIPIDFHIFQRGGLTTNQPNFAIGFLALSIFGDFWGMFQRMSISENTIVGHHSAGSLWPRSSFPSMSGWWFGTFFIFPYIGNVIIPIDSYFSEGWPNHQPDVVLLLYHVTKHIVSCITVRIIRYTAWSMCSRHSPRFWKRHTSTADVRGGVSAFRRFRGRRYCAEIPLWDWNSLHPPRWCTKPSAVCCHGSTSQKKNNPSWMCWNFTHPTRHPRWKACGNVPGDFYGMKNLADSPSTSAASSQSIPNKVARFEAICKGCSGKSVCFWLVVWLPFLAFSHILGMSSSQLTHIFQRGGLTTNQVSVASSVFFTVDWPRGLDLRQKNLASSAKTPRFKVFFPTVWMLNFPIFCCWSATNLVPPSDANVGL